MQEPVVTRQKPQWREKLPQIAHREFSLFARWIRSFVSILNAKYRSLCVNTREEKKQTHTHISCCLCQNFLNRFIDAWSLYCPPCTHVCSISLHFKSPFILFSILWCTEKKRLFSVFNVYAVCIYVDPGEFQFGANFVVFFLSLCLSVCLSCRNKTRHGGKKHKYRRIVIFMTSVASIRRNLFRQCNWKCK